MRRLYIPNDFVEWFVIIIGCTVAGLAGAGLKSWLDNALENSETVSWVPGIAALALFFLLAAPFYLWAARSAKHREGGSTVEAESATDSE